METCCDVLESDWLISLFTDGHISSPSNRLHDHPETLPYGKIIRPRNILKHVNNGINWDTNLELGTEHCILNRMLLWIFLILMDRDEFSQSTAIVHCNTILVYDSELLH